MQPPAHVASWFELKSETLANAKEGLAADNVGVVTRFTWPGPTDGLPENALQLAQEAIREAKWRLNPQSPEWAGHAIGEALDLDSRDNLDGGHGICNSQLKEIIKHWLKTGGLVSYEDKDAKSKTRDFVKAGK
jgi:hypothetical protein